jgi:hypothetical protein
MAAHQSIVTSLRVKIKGRPTRHGGRHGVIPAGTIGYIHGYEPYTSWDTTTKVYNFYPNNFTETTGYYVKKTGSTETTEPLTNRHRIIVLADDIVYHVSEASDPNLEPVVDIAICEAGYARIIGLSGDTGGGFPKNLRRCVIEIDSSGSPSPCKFVLRELNGTPVETMGREVPVWAGRLLSHQKSQTAFIFARDSASTYDIEFFRVRPIVRNSSTASAGSSETATYRDPSRPKKKRTALDDPPSPRAVRAAGGLDEPTYAAPSDSD